MELSCQLVAVHVSVNEDEMLVEIKKLLEFVCKCNRISFMTHRKHAIKLQDISKKNSIF